MEGIDEIIKSLQRHQNILRSLGLSSRTSEMLKAQEGIYESISGLSMINEIVKNIHHKIMIANPASSAVSTMTKSISLQSKFAIPKTTLDAITSINRRHDRLFGGIRVMSETLKIPTPAVRQINKLQIVLSSISVQIAALATQQRNWTIIEDFDQVTVQTLYFSESLTDEITEEQQNQFQILLTLVGSFLRTHKTLGVSALLVIDIVLRIAGIHQYYDFLQERPEIPTKTEVNNISINQDSVLHFMQLVNEQLKKAKEYRITSQICEVKLKPKTKTLTLAKLPKGIEIIVIRIHHKWVYVSFIDTEDNLPQTGWIKKKYLKKPK